MSYIRIFHCHSIIKIRKLSLFQNIFRIVKDTKFFKYISKYSPPKRDFLFFAYNEMFLTQSFNFFLYRNFHGILLTCKTIVQFFIKIHIIVEMHVCSLKLSFLHDRYLKAARISYCGSRKSFTFYLLFGDINRSRFRFPSEEKSLSKYFRKYFLAHVM